MMGLFASAYQHIFKPIAFTQDPEKVHDRITAVGEFLGRFGLTRALTHAMFGYENLKLERTVAGITFKNPIGLAAGFDKNAHLLDILPYVGFGFAEIGSMTANPSSGNPKPRLWRLPESQALVVNYGLMNDGVDVILERIRRSRIIRYRALNNVSSRAEAAEAWRSRSDAQNEIASSKAPRNDNKDEILRQAQDDKDKVLVNFRIGISVAKTNCKDTADEAAGIADYFECFQKVNASGLADYITVNISCPNAYGGEPFTTPDKFERLSARLKEVQWNVPVFLKLPCDYSNEELDAMLDVAVQFGYSGVILSNLTKDRINNPVILKSDLSKVGKGGISGKPTFEKSNALIRRVRERYSSKQLAIVGCGGVFSGEDAKIKFAAGADLIQMITGMIYQGPQAVGEINKFLSHED